MRLAAATKVCIAVSRSIEGFPFASATSLDQKNQISDLLGKALSSLGGNGYSGRYRPFSAEREGQDWSRFGHLKEEEIELANLGLLFGVPESITELAAGLGLHWPHGRGLFVSDSRLVAAWVNQAEHLRLVTLDDTGDIHACFMSLCEVLKELEKSLGGHQFSRHEKLGFLNASPASIGTGGLRVMVTLRLPNLSQHRTFPETCRGLGLSARSCSPPMDDCALWEVSNYDVFGTSELELVDSVLTACELLVGMEAELAASKA